MLCNFFGKCVFAFESFSQALSFFLCSIHCVDSTDLLTLLSRKEGKKVKYKLKGPENTFLLLEIPRKDEKRILSKCEDADEHVARMAD